MPEGYRQLPITVPPREHHSHVLAGPYVGSEPVPGTINLVHAISGMASGRRDLYVAIERADPVMSVHPAILRIWRRETGERCRYADCPHPHGHIAVEDRVIRFTCYDEQYTYVLDPEPHPSGWWIARWPD